jgi:hypothetical protein
MVEDVLAFWFADPARWWRRDPEEEEFLSQPGSSF